MIIGAGAAQRLEMLNQAFIVLSQELQRLWYRGHGGGSFPDFFANAIQSYTLQRKSSLEFSALKTMARTQLQAEATSPVFQNQSPCHAPQTALNGS